MAKFGRRGFTRSSLIDRKAHCVEAARSCQMLSRVITKQHHETVLIQCLNAMVGITRSKVIFRLKRYLGTTLTKKRRPLVRFQNLPTCDRKKQQCHNPRRERAQDPLEEFAFANLLLFAATIRRQFTPKQFLLIWQCL